jgi:peptidoglycan/xylan/chitin deacetylase (PgdA/CDA1 family)
MRKIVRLIVAAIFYYSGLVALGRWWMRQQSPHLIILNYHRSSLGDIRQHMRYLQRHYRLLPLEEALQELYAEPTQKNHRRTPVVMTFDDGYRDNFQYAFKAAVELQVPITIFLIPGYIDSGERFWWGEGRYLVAQTLMKEITFDNLIYHLQSTEDQRRLAVVIDTRLRTASSVVEREQFLAKMRQTLAISEFDSCLLDVEYDNMPLSWLDVYEMQKSGFVSFGAHTMHHPVLSSLVDPVEVHYEIAQCREVLEKQLGQKVYTFAYPLGRTEHIGSEALKGVRAAEYKWAVTTTSGIATPQSDPYRIERVLVDVQRHWLLIAAETAGIWHMFAPLWRPFTHGKEYA